MSTHRLHLVFIIFTTTLLLSTTPKTLSIALFSGHHHSTKNHHHHHHNEHVFHPNRGRNHARTTDKDFDSEKRRVPTGSNPLHNRR
ncbi:hypothetical protein ABFS83_13G015300 [Erythranthe nasuta]